MTKVGFVGLGDMGFAMAGNILKANFPLIGYDLDEVKVKKLESIGGKGALSIEEVGENSEIVFIMVMTGKQAAQVANKLVSHLPAGGTLVLSATIHAHEVERIYQITQKNNLHLIDSPVSGGLSGAQEGTLTLMIGTNKANLDNHCRILECISKKIFHVGEKPGMGQKVKSVLQSLIGSVFASIFETLVLGSKAGINGQILFDVIQSSAVNCGLFENCAPLIMDRKFKGTGSQIATMYKDLGITNTLGHKVGSPLFMANTALEMFKAGITKYPDEDNWTIVKILEEITDTEVNRN